MPFEQIVDGHLEIFNSTASPARTTAIAQTYTEDVIAGKPDVRLTGHASMERAIDGMHEQLPGMAISRTGPVQEVHELVIFPWATGPKGGPPVVTGREVMIIRDGSKVASFYVLVDPSPLERPHHDRLTTNHGKAAPASITTKWSSR